MCAICGICMRAPDARVDQELLRRMTTVLRHRGPDGDGYLVRDNVGFGNRRLSLIDRGHRFATKSDTEVIVHLYEEYGERCVDHLRGMFAFAIWDGQKNRVFLARDRLGI